MANKGIARTVDIHTIKKEHQSHSTSSIAFITSVFLRMHKFAAEQPRRVISFTDGLSHRLNMFNWMKAPTGSD